MTTELAPNSKDPRVVRTRRILIREMAVQLHKTDFNAITVREIVKNASVNRATFYAHFSDKYALLDAMLEDAFREYFLAGSDGVGLTEETVTELIVALCEYRVASEKCIKKYETVAPIVENDVKGHLRGFIRRLLGGGDGTTDERTSDTAATLVSWALYGLAQQWDREGRTEEPLELARRAAPLIASGFAAPARSASVPGANGARRSRTVL